MAAAVAPTLYDRRTKATFDLFKELGCLRDGGDGELKITDVGRLDEEKMMARALDCLAAVCEAQRVRVALKLGKHQKLREDGDALAPAQQAVRHKVFRVAVNALLKDLTHDGAEREGPGIPMSMTDQLLYAFPDSSKLKDGRGWLPMHWAVVADEDKESGVTEADVKAVYGTDLMALRTHHLATVTYTDTARKTFGYTPAHMLCGLEMTEKNMSLVRQLSKSNPRAFTMTAVDRTRKPYGKRALHVACMNRRRTEALLRLLLQLDPSQMEPNVASRGPLGLLCAHSADLDECQFGCLVEADSSVEVVYDAIYTCIIQASTFKNRVQTVAKLLEINPAAAQHADDGQRNLTHWTCFCSDRMAAADCIEILKLVLARHKDAMKELDDEGQLPAHLATSYGPVKVLDFVLGEYAEAATMVDNESRNLLHIAAGEGVVEHREANARMLCARYPAMMLQRNSNGYTPLLESCLQGHGAIALLLCEAGGWEAVSNAIQHPNVDQEWACFDDGKLPLHLLIDYESKTLTAEPLSALADVFRLLLRLYPEAAGIEGGVGARKETPYQLAVEKGLPAYYRRLLLHAAPDLDPAELRRLNWAERRMAMFVAFEAVAESPPLLAQLRAENKDLVKHVVSFL